MLKRDDLLGRLQEQGGTARNYSSRLNHYQQPPVQQQQPPPPPPQAQNPQYQYTLQNPPNYRPSSYQGQRYSWSPSPRNRPPPSRRSLPADLSQQRYIPQQQQQPPPPQQRFSQMQQQFLPPIAMTQPQQQVYTLPQVQPAPAMVLQAPAAQGTAWNKGDFMEMMMMQNAQMHQMVMNQMMMGAIPQIPNNNQHRNHNCAPNIIQVQDPSPQVLSMPSKRPPSVHHHHYGYNEPAAPGPVISHITHLPPIDLRYRQPPPPPPPLAPAPVVIDRYPSEVEPLRQPRDNYHDYYRRPQSYYYY